MACAGAAVAMPLEPMESDRVKRPKCFANLRKRIDQSNEPSSALKDAPSHSLPVWQCRGQIIESICSNQVTIVVGETGSGKTTQIPQMLHDHYQGQRTKKERSKPPIIAITQPRQVAAISLANRVREEMAQRERGRSDNDDSRMGGTVGYAVRFQRRVSAATRIKFLTDGILLREGLMDPLYRRYRVIMVDEAHERSLRSDIILGLLKLLLKERPSLRVVIMSATLDYRMFVEFFKQDTTAESSISVETIIVPGRQYPVSIFHAPKINREDYVTVRCTNMRTYAKPLQNMVASVIQVHLTGDAEGDLLAFLPGQDDIARVRSLLEDKNAQLDRIETEFAQFGSELRRLQGVLVAEREAALKSKNKAFQGLLNLLQDKSSDSIVVDVLSRSSFSGLSLSTYETTGVRKSTGNSLLPHQPAGNVLMSSALTSREADAHQSTRKTLRMEILPLYAALPLHQQRKVFEPAPEGRRKIILATNIAETSVTIPGIRYVVDSGFCKVKSFDPASGIETLAVKAISRSMASQRAGRAGREGHGGQVYRLYSEDEYYSMEVQADPEVARSNLAATILQLKAFGVRDPLKFPFITKPGPTALKKATELLMSLGALDKDQDEITEMGSRLVSFPVDPEYAHLLLQSYEFKCTAEMLTIVAMLNVEDLWYNGKGEGGSERAFSRTARKQITSIWGDHLTLLNAYNLWNAASEDIRRKIDICKAFGLSNHSLTEASNIRQQLKDILLSDSIGLPTIPSCLVVVDEADSKSDRGKESAEVIRRCLVKAFPNRVARLVMIEKTVEAGEGAGDADKVSRAQYVVEKTRTPVWIHPTSTLFGRSHNEKFVLFDTLTKTTRLYMQHVTPVDWSWLMQYHPNLFTGQLVEQQKKT